MTLLLFSHDESVLIAQRDWVGEPPPTYEMYLVPPTLLMLERAEIIGPFRWRFARVPAPPRGVDRSDTRRAEAVFYRAVEPPPKWYEGERRA